MKQDAPYVRLGNDDQAVSTPEVVSEAAEQYRSLKRGLLERGKRDSFSCEKVWTALEIPFEKTARLAARQ